MNVKLKRALLIIGPLVVGVGVILWVNRKKKPTEEEKKQEENADTLASKTKVTTIPPAPDFPIQQGSKGEKVKEVQRAIGVTADGVFGPKTEAALVAKAGMRVVSSQKELDQIKKMASGQSSMSRANDIINKYNNDKSLSMFIVANTPADVVNIDTYGAVFTNGNQITMYGGKLYNRDDYKPFQATKSGNLLFEVTRGALKGTYMIDPNFVSLK